MRPGERLLWTGGPDPAKMFTAADGFLVPFSVAWCAFAVFWEFGAATTRAPLFFKIWGGLFVVIGLYFVVGRFVVKRHRKRRCVYALTDQRAIIFENRASVRDTPLVGQPVAVNRSRDGRHATVTIGYGGVRGWNRMAMSMYANTGMDVFARGQGAFAFYDVPDPEPMLAALEQARQQPSR
jgi:hypothetical protein